MINEEFDDEVSDEEFTEIVITSATRPVAEVPKGDFKHVLAGRDVWFKSPKPGQFHAWKRYRQSLAKQFDKAKKRAETESTIELLQLISGLSEKHDLATIEFVEAMVVDPDDLDFLAMKMISGDVTVVDLHHVLFGNPEDDDVEPAPKPKKPAKKSAANAKRTKR